MTTAAPQPTRPAAARTGSLDAPANRGPHSSSPTTTPAGAAPAPDETSAEPTAEQAAESAPEPALEPAPEPTPEPAPEPDPVPTPSDESPKPTPTEPPASEVATVTGVWSANDEGQFLLDGTLVVEVQALGDLTGPAPTDLDADGIAETVRDELEGLTSSTLEVTGTVPEPGVLALRSFDDLRRLPE